MAPGRGDVRSKRHFVLPLRGRRAVLKEFDFVAAFEPLAVLEVVHAHGQFRVAAGALADFSRRRDFLGDSSPDAMICSSFRDERHRELIWGRPHQGRGEGKRERKQTREALFITQLLAVFVMFYP